MILSKPDQVRKDIKDNPLKTAKDKKRFKKQVLDNVDDYLQYLSNNHILNYVTQLHMLI